MFVRCVIPILLFAFASPILAAPSEDAAAIADRYLADMQKKNYAFLSKDELARRREDIATFTDQKLTQHLDAKTLDAILTGIDRCLGRLYPRPAGTLSYSNGFGSGAVVRTRFLPKT